MHVNWIVAAAFALLTSGGFAVFGMAVAATVYEKLLTADTNSSATIGPGRASRCKEWVAYCVFSAGVTAGIYAIESAPYENYAGTWKNIGTLTWAAASATVSVNFTGIHGAIRIRNTTPVANGTADIYLIGRE